LALRFNGEIINGDAVQMYDGLPIITNKISEDERRGVPHHLLGCVGLQEPTWRVDRFVKEALLTVSAVLRVEEKNADRVLRIDQGDSFQRTTANTGRWDALLHTVTALQ
jgi:hypothetical protein